MASAEIPHTNLNVKRRREPMLVGQQVIDPERIIGTPEWQERQNHLQSMHAKNFVAHQKRALEDALAKREVRNQSSIFRRDKEVLWGPQDENPLPQVPQIRAKSRGPRRNPDAPGGMAEVPYKKNRRDERERQRPRRPITEL